MTVLDSDKHGVSLDLQPWGLVADFGERRWCIPFANIKAMELL